MDGAGIAPWVTGWPFSLVWFTTVPRLVGYAIGPRTIVGYVPVNT